MAGTDTTRAWIGEGGPVIVLVEPQLAENIGTAARAMANFGLDALRIVNPREAWPSERARAVASGADRVIDKVEVYSTLAEALADLNFVYATTARDRGLAKPVEGPAEAAAEMARRLAGGERTGVIFGRERTGLYTEEVGFADRLLTFPVNPAFASLNLAQAVLLVGYEWFRTRQAPLPFGTNDASPMATKDQLFGLFGHLEGALSRAGFFRPPEKEAAMVKNIRAIFHRTELTDQDIRTLRGMIVALEHGRGDKRNRIVPDATGALVRPAAPGEEEG